jgi:hypothetical protein
MLSAKLGQTQDDAWTIRVPRDSLSALICFAYTPEP